ncbi:SHOCT domain-containing protein [Methylorubrum sp. SB2]|uniref:SHOCT domain-containing protein n=1 Tax=Methylorubrum subtropicum TaxID=3138812 RepID=UPI00313C2DC8
MSEDTAERRTNLAAVAERHGVGVEVVQHLVRALEAGHGNMAQFDHPDLGGLGQWSRGGMIMVGRMNDHALKARVDALCTELAATLPPPETHGLPGAGNWWPDGLGVPSSVGAQDGTRYAFFPTSRRLAVETGGRVKLYDLGDREVTGVSQQQGGTGSFRFSGPAGSFSLGDLTPVEAEAKEAEAAKAAPKVEASLTPEPSPAPRPDTPAPAKPAPRTSGFDETLSILERLAELHRKGVLTEAEFAQKKTELLARL